VDGQDIGLIYDSGAQVNTFTKSLFNKYFANRPSARFRPKVGPSVVGAGENNMGYSDCYTMPVKFGGKRHMIPFCVVENMEHCLIGVNGLQILDLSYDAKAKEIFTVNNQMNLVS
jgi:hypothetical protein